MSASVFKSGFGAWPSVDVAARKLSDTLRMTVGVDFMPVAYRRRPPRVYAVAQAADEVDTELLRPSVSACGSRGREDATAPGGEANLIAAGSAAPLRGPPMDERWSFAAAGLRRFRQGIVATPDLNADAALPL